MATYKISDIEGIGPAYAKRLRSAGIKTTRALLDGGADRVGRKRIAETAGLEESLVLKWVNMADLYRVKGIGSEYAELLEKAGVDTVKELRTRNAANLAKKVREINARGRRLVRAVPSERRIAGWIADAQDLAPRITY